MPLASLKIDHTDCSSMRDVVLTFSNDCYSRGIFVLNDISKSFILINFDTIATIKIAF